MPAPQPISLQLLIGSWQIALDPDDRGRTDRWFLGNPDGERREAPVPGSIQHVFPGRHGVAWYWHSFSPVRQPARGERALLRFHAVDYRGDIWLNGQYLGSHEGSETPFSLDATDALQPGANLLAVRVLNPTAVPIDGITLGQIPHRNRMLSADFHPGNGLNYGGIVQHVAYLVVPTVRIVDLVARSDAETGEIAVILTIRNDAKVPADMVLHLVAGGAQAQSVLTTVTTGMVATPGETLCEAQFRVPEHRLWSLDDPYLYQIGARATAIVPDGTIYEHEYTVRCGFRDFRVLEGYFRLNGKRLFLRSTHTGNHFPIGSSVPDDHDLVRRDLIYAKAAGFNMVRFIAGMALAEQLDVCDEIGLLVYEENLAAWKLEDSPQMPERFDHALREMILRDRSHPSVVIWGLLNETPDTPVFRHAVAALPLVRELDPNRLVLLSSGRWDRDLSIGSASNPGSRSWEPVWGHEGSDQHSTATSGHTSWDAGQAAYVAGAGDVHVYPLVPQSDQTDTFLRTLGADSKPIFLSEYGIGSLLDVDQILRRYQQAGTAATADDLRIFGSMYEQLEADWNRYRLDVVYPFPRDLLRESQRLHARQRLHGLNLIRANPQIAGYNLTGMLDHGYTGEGVWTFWREWKPGIVDALTDGFTSLRWCLFVTPSHIYAGRTVAVETVLANEDVLAPGRYPARFRIFGPAGPIWEHHSTVVLPSPVPGTDSALAVPAFTAAVALDGPPGTYTLAAQLERGGSPAGDRITFHVSDPAALPVLHTDVMLWGIEEHVAGWLGSHGVQCRPRQPSSATERTVILVGDPGEGEAGSGSWRELARSIARGCTVVFLSPMAFRRGANGVGWLPLAVKGRCHAFSNWLYHREDIARPHPIFAGLPGPGIMEWDYYGPVIPRYVFEGQETPDDIAAVYVATGYASMTEVVPSGYASGLLVASYPLGAGRFVINSLRILEHIDRHPVADRLLLNMIEYAASLRMKAPAPVDIDTLLATLGIVE